MDTKKNLKIYVVEDMAVARMSLVQILTRKGHTVVGSAASADAAIAQFKELEIDLVLLDVNLRGTKDGVFIGQHLRENYNLPFIYLTAYSDDVTLERIQNTKPNGYLMKPYDKATLLTTIAIAYSNFKDLKPTQSPDIQIDDFFIVNKKTTKLKVYFKDIRCVIADGNYLKIKTADNMFMERMTIKQALKILPINTFIKINKGQIVNVNFISACSGESISVDHEWFPISRVYKKTLLSIFTDIKRRED